MHQLKLTEEIKLRPDYVIAPGEYVADDINAAQLIALAGCGQMQPYTNPKLFDDSQDWNGKKVLLVRAGGFGDLVLMTPVFREIRRRWPTVMLHVSTLRTYNVVLKGLNSVDAAIEYPVPLAALSGYDGIVFFENAVERNPRAEVLHMTDLYAEIAGLRKALGLAGGGHPPLDVKQAEYVVMQNEMVWLLEQYPRNPGKRRLCMQTGTSGLCRLYPGSNYEVILRTLMERGWEVFLLGARGEVNERGIPKIPDLYNLTAINTTFRQSAAVINSSDCFLGNDSALLHVAGALNIPAVGLYGAFPHELRTTYAPHTVGMQGKGSCAPCFHHANPVRKNHFPDNCPSKAVMVDEYDTTGHVVGQHPERHCQVLADIKPTNVISTIERIAKKFELKEVEA